MTDAAPARLAMFAAWTIVYVVWGSTYLAIRVAVEDVPPAMLAGVRFILASLVLGALALARGQRLPTSLRTWWVCTVMGVALIVLGNGLVTWAEQWVPSNQAAYFSSRVSQISSVLDDPSTMSRIRTHEPGAITPLGCFFPPTGSVSVRNRLAV